MTPTTKPLPPPLSEDALVGDHGVFILTVDAAFRKPLCVYAQRLIASLRAASVDDGEQLKALARMEAAITSALVVATKEPQYQTGYAKPE